MRSGFAIGSFGIRFHFILQVAVYCWKNQFITWLVEKFRPPKRKSESMQRILIVSTTALGDTLWATPAIHNLRCHFPKATIAVLTSPVGQQALALNPDIDRFYLLKEPLLPRFFSLLKQIKKEQFDIALIFHASQRLVLPLCALAGIGRIIGSVGINKGLDSLLTDAIEPCLEHEIERRLRICDRIGVSRGTQTLSFYVQDEERKKAQQQIVALPRPFIAIHPGSKEAFRRWPAICFAAVAKNLNNRFGGTIFLTGSQTETSLVHEVQKYMPKARIANVSASIQSLGAFLEQMDLVLSNDTGPFHLACALNRPTVGLYVSTDPALCGPYHAPQSIIITRATTCTPCLKRRCKNPFCFLQIAPSEVIKVCTNILKN